MADRPIIFSAPMVRALLAERKTQTRRVLKPQPHREGSFWRWHGGGWWSGSPTLVPGHSMYEKAPARPGDRLWVRESCRADELPTGDNGVRFTADDAFVPILNTPEAASKWVDLSHYGASISDGVFGRSVPSIHMPRWASRLTLSVTDVRVQRLQDISEEDAVAEGIHVQSLAELASEGRLVGAGRKPILMAADDPAVTYMATPDADCSWSKASNAFRDLWQDINGADAWAANPWVAAISFTVHRGNIDALSSAADQLSQAEAAERADA